MPPVGFEPTIAAGLRPRSYWDRHECSLDDQIKIVVDTTCNSRGENKYVLAGDVPDDVSRHSVHKHNCEGRGIVLNLGTIQGRGAIFPYMDFTLRVRSPLYRIACWAAVLLSRSFRYSTLCYVC